MKAIILAAGLGSRLLPLTADRPKCLVPAGGLTILQHQLLALSAAGVEDVHVVGGYRFDQLADFVERLEERLRPKLILNPFYAVSSSIGSVWAARHLLDGPFLLLNGDSLYEARPLADAVHRVPDGLSLLIEVAGELEADDMLVNAQFGQVLEVGKDLNPARANHRSLGIVASSGQGGGYRAALEEVISAPGGDQRFHHDVVDLLAKRVRVNAVTIEAGTWQEIDSPADIERWLGAADSAAA